MEKENKNKETDRAIYVTDTSIIIEKKVSEFIKEKNGFPSVIKLL